MSDMFSGAISELKKLERLRVEPVMILVASIFIYISLILFAKGFLKEHSLFDAIVVTLGISFTWSLIVSLNVSDAFKLHTFSSDDIQRTNDIIFTVNSVFSVYSLLFSIVTPIIFDSLFPKNYYWFTFYLFVSLCIHKILCVVMEAKRFFPKFLFGLMVSVYLVCCVVKLISKIF